MKLNEMTNISIYNIIHIKYIHNLTRFLHEFLNTFQKFEQCSHTRIINFHTKI